ncbi:MAG: 2-hydroxyacyl-CoA dehydratase family protein [Desulfosalsimonadaceae bacterium]|nr:2-hydroxyacyl-CoA dehydratase family protein [Desulfosalsimonadaceae bacterium]
MDQKQKIGFACAYTPLPLIDAAGYAPFRILPVGDCPDQAGHLLHDNLCPNIKRILDRAMSADLPDLAGSVFINSCDAMRRMADAWNEIRKNDRTILLDLPATADDLSISFFRDELVRAANALGDWRGEAISPEAVNRSIDKYNEISRLLMKIAPKFHQGSIEGGGAALQTVYNQAATSSLDDTLARLKQLQDAPDADAQKNNGVPVYLFGNVMPDPEAFTMIESCGARIVNDDFCTGSRMFTPVADGDTGDVFLRLSKAMLTRPPCARTFDPARPGKIAEDVLNNAKAAHAMGVIGHTVKFCDPYLERLPFIRETLKDAGMPLLLLEGDCTLRSIGQQKTRIEAFIEMLR